MHSVFTNAGGTTTPVRWIMKPITAVRAGYCRPTRQDYLFDELITQILRQPPPLAFDSSIRWKASDSTANPRSAWPADREAGGCWRVDPLDRVEAEEFSAAHAYQLRPMTLPGGYGAFEKIRCLSARRPVYWRSFHSARRRDEAAESDHPADVKREIAKAHRTKQHSQRWRRIMDSRLKENLGPIEPGTRHYRQDATEKRRRPNDRGLLPVRPGIEHLTPKPVGYTSAIFLAQHSAAA